MITPEQLREVQEQIAEQRDTLRVARDALQDAEEALAEAVKLLRATTSCIGTIEDDDHWKAREAAEAFLAKLDAS